MSSILPTTNGNVAFVDTFGARIEWLLERRGLSQRELSTRIGKSPNYVSQWKRGEIETPGWDVVEKVCEILGCNSEWLLGGTGPAPSERMTNDPYPTRATVIAMARIQGVRASVIEGLQAEFHKDGDPGHDYWMRRLHEVMSGSREIDRWMKNGGGEDDGEAFD